MIKRAYKNEGHLAEVPLVLCYRAHLLNNTKIKMRSAAGGLPSE